MPEPIDFQIVQSVQQALQAIAVAAGYHYDVVATAVKLDPNQAVEELVAPDGPRPFVLIELPPFPPPEYHPAMQIRKVLPLTIHWVSDSTPTDDTSRLKTFCRGLADVERAIAVDVTRGGLAYDTRIGQQSLDMSVGGAQVWAVTEVQVLIHRTYGAPDA